jgi:hypothetical protein
MSQKDDSDHSKKKWKKCCFVEKLHLKSWSTDQFVNEYFFGTTFITLLWFHSNQFLHNNN